jgi:RHS repeat-associated protein
MTKKKYSGTTEEYNYTYKEDTRLLLTASGPSGTINYTYDNLYRLTQVVDPYYNTTSYEYDEGNRRKTMTVSKTYETCQYVYDSSNQLVSIDNHGSFGFEYDAFGQMSKKTMANGTYTELQSDHLGRLKRLMNYKGLGAAVAPGSVISEYRSEQAGDFDLLGNRKKVSTLDGNYEYKYDSVYQLTESKVNGLLSEGYSYDSVGNRLVGAYRDTPSNNYVYNNNNRLISITDSTANQTYTYDNNGSRITKIDSTGITNYTYDYDNRLKRIDFADSSYAEYTYDALGRRIQKLIFKIQDSTYTINRYSYDGEDIIAVLDSTNTAIASITHGPGIDHPLSYKNIATGQVYYYNQDYLGSITSITDSAQNVVESYKYDAFGNQLTPNASTLQLVYAFTGREYDQESGLYFYRARYYDSKVGRFLQADPIGFMGGVNFYAYVGNCPVNFVDPWGLCKKKNRNEMTAEELSEEWEKMTMEEIIKFELKNGGAVPVPLYEDPIFWACFVFARGPELVISKDLRFAPLGNRTRSPTGQLPHYHRRIIDPSTGLTRPGGGIGNHRPWQWGW